MSIRKMITRRDALIASLTLGVGLACPPILRARAAVQLRLGSDSPLNDEHTLALVKMKEAIEAKTDGRVAVAIFPDGQLGANDVMMNAVKGGTLME